MSLLKHAEKSGRRFLNPVPTPVAGLSTIFKIIPLYLERRGETEPRIQPGPFATDPAVYSVPPSSGLRVTWFGHSSMLLEIDGVRLPIDPVWEQRASPVQRMGPRRFFPPPIPLDQLPPVDAVLISHDHYDHLGAHTVRRLARSPVAAGAEWITSLGVAARLRKLGVPAGLIRELDWTESTALTSASGAPLKLTAWPARHFSGRGLFDRFTTLWSSFVIEGDQHRIFFGADSGWWEGFSEIAARYDGFDLTMLEIGAFHPLWNSIHLGPDNALRAHADLAGARRAGLLMPIHWGLFNLALHSWRQPIETLELAASDAQIDLWSPEPGVPTDVAGPHLSDWWRADSAPDTVRHCSCNPVENRVQG